MKEIKLQLDNIFMKYGLSPEIKVRETQLGYCIECVQKGFTDVTDTALVAVTCMVNFDVLSFLTNKTVYTCSLMLDFLVYGGPKNEYSMNEVFKFNNNHNNTKFYYEHNYDHDDLILSDQFTNIGTSQVAYYLDILLSRIYNEEVYEFLKNLYIRSTFYSLLS